MAENIQLTLENHSSITSLVDTEINLDIATSSSSNNDDISFFTCDICVELVPLNAKFKNMEIIGCSHNHCTGCIAKYIQEKVIQDNTPQIKCPDTNCSAVLETLSCRPIVSKNIFDKWCRVHCESLVLLGSSKGGFSYGRSYCPYRDCSELVLNECFRTKVTKSNCPNCKRLFCFHCMVPWKENHRCVKRSESTIIDIDSNDVLFLEKVKHNKLWVRCPSCSHYVERNKGCRYIRCRCKTIFCHDCGEHAGYCMCNRRMSDRQNMIQHILFTSLTMLIVTCGLIVVAKYGGRTI